MPVTDDEVLDAALEQLAHLGIRRTTTDDIARAAGVNRTTLYRRLGSKEDIVQAALLREVQRFIDGIRAYVDTHDELEDRVAGGFARTVVLMRRHPLMQRMLSLQEYDALASLTVEAAGPLRLGTSFVEQVLAESKAASGFPAGRHDAVFSALVARLIHSLVLTPSAPPVLRTEKDLRSFALTYLMPLMEVR